MKKTQIKISASRLSEALLVAVSLSCFSFANTVYAVDPTVIQKQETTIAGSLQENLVQQVAINPSLDFKPVQLAQYSANEDGNNGIKLLRASTHNLGHLHELLSRVLTGDYTNLNTLQKSAADLSSDFVSQVAQQAYSYFESIYNFASVNTISKNAEICAKKTWLVLALIDYGQVSEAYRLIAGEKNKEHAAFLRAEDEKLKIKLEEDIKAKETAKTAKNLELNVLKEKAENKKAELRELLKKPLPNDDIKAHEKDIQELETTLNMIEKNRLAFNKANKQEIENLTNEYNLKISKLNSMHQKELQELQAQFNAIFEYFGNSGGLKTYQRSGLLGMVGLTKWDRSMRSEFPIFDKLLSTQYPDLYPAARTKMLKSIFSLIEDDDTAVVAQKRSTLKALLNLDDSTYGSIVQSLIAQQKQTQKELEAVEAAFTATLTQVIQEVTSPPLPQTGADEKPTPTIEQSKVAQAIAQGFDLSKKKSDESTVNNSEEGEQEEASVLPLGEVSMPSVSSADKKASEKGINGSASLAIGKIPSPFSYVIPLEGMREGSFASSSLGNNGTYFPQLNTFYPSFSEVVSRNGQHSSSVRPNRPISLNAAKETDFSPPVNSTRNVSKDSSSSTGGPSAVGSSANNGATREATTEQKKNKRRYYHGKRTHSRVYNSGKPGE